MHIFPGNDTASDSNHEDNDEGFDDASIDPKLLKKLKKVIFNTNVCQWFSPVS